MSSKAQRLGEFITQLSQESPAWSRISAYALLHSTMEMIEDRHRMPKGDNRTRMAVWPMTTFHDWSDLNGDPCHWLDTASKSHKTVIWNDGSVQIYRKKTCEETSIDEWALIFSKVGIGQRVEVRRHYLESFHKMLTNLGLAGSAPGKQVAQSILDHCAAYP